MPPSGLLGSKDAGAIEGQRLLRELTALNASASFPVIETQAVTSVPAAKPLQRSQSAGVQAGSSKPATTPSRADKKRATPRTAPSGGRGQDRDAVDDMSPSRRQELLKSARTKKLEQQLAASQAADEQAATFEDIDGMVPVVDLTHSTDGAGTDDEATDAAGDRELCRRRLIKLGKSRATETDLEMISEDAEDAEDDEDMPVQPVRPRRAATQSLATPVKPALTSVGPGSKSGGKTATKGQPGVARSTQQTARKSRGAAETAVQTARTSADAGEPSETEKGEKRDRDERGRKISQNRVPVPAGIKTTGAVHDIAELCPFCLSCLGDMRYFPDVACWIHPIVNETDDISCADCDGRKKKTGKCVPCPPVLLQSMEYKAYLLIAGGVACGKMDSALLEAAFKTFEARKDLYFAEQRRRDQAYEDRPIPRLAEVLTEQIVVLGSRPSPLQAQVSRAADNTASATASIENVVDRLVAIETTVTQMHRDLHNMRLLQERMALKSGFKRAQVPAPAAASGGRKRTHDDMEGAEEVYEAVEQHSEEGAGGFQHPGGDTGLGAVGDEEMDDTV